MASLSSAASPKDTKAAASPSSSQLFGSLPKAGFLRRGKLTSISVATPKPKPPKPDDDYTIDGTSSDAPADSCGSSSALTSVDSLAVSDLFLSQEPTSSTADSAVSSDSSGPLHNPGSGADRRASVISTVSFTPSIAPSLAGSTNGHGGGPSASYLASHRNSLSSYASSSGSPLATASSNGTTIGDLSTASMPLLPNLFDDPRQHSWGGGERSMSDGHGIRPGVASIASSRRLDSSSASFSDTSSIHSYPPVRRPRTANSTATTGSRANSVDGEWRPWRRDFKVDGSAGSTQNYSRVARVTQTPPNPVMNPFAPLRKRLIRTLTTGKGVAGVEIQLIVELIDALENYIRAPPPNTDTLTAEAGSLSSGSLANEIASLIQELCEVAPEVPRSLAAGMYGPFASPTSPNIVFRDQPHMYDPSSSKWWPRRLARDCRGLLEDVSMAADAPSRSPIGAPLPVPLVLDALLVPMEVEPLTLDSVTLPRLPSGEELSRADLDRPPLEPRNSDEEPASLEAAEARRAERQAELLIEGKRRWAEYRQRQLSLSGGDPADMHPPI